MKHQLSDYGVKLRILLIKYDNTSVINLIKNLILPSQKKQVNIRLHFIRDFIRDHVEKRN